jgi:hypothetical protein
MADCQHSDITWAGPLADRCQLTGEAFNGVMYDARTPQGWANIGQTAFDRFKCRLGTGYGQKYELRDCGHWEKVGG